MSLIYLLQNVRFLRKALHFSQWQVTLWLNVERSSYTYYELGRTMPPLPVLLKLAWFFEISLDGLVLTDLTKTPPEYLYNPRNPPPNWNKRRKIHQNHAGAGNVKSTQLPDPFVYSSLAAFGRLFFCPLFPTWKRLFPFDFPPCIIHGEGIE